MSWKILTSEGLSSVVNDLSNELAENLSFLSEGEKEQRLQRLAQALTTEEKTVITAELCVDSADRISAVDPDGAMHYYNLAAELFHALPPHRFRAQLRRGVLAYLNLRIPSQVRHRAAEEILLEVTGLLNRLYGAPPADLELAAHGVVIDSYERLRQASIDDPEALDQLHAVQAVHGNFYRSQYPTTCWAACLTPRITRPRWASCNLGISSSFAIAPCGRRFTTALWRPIAGLRQFIPANAALCTKVSSWRESAKPL